MALNIIKLCVGAHSVEDLAAWQSGLMAEQKARRERPRVFHTTLQTPKRQAELLDGGSLYWVIKGLVQARQRLLGFEDGHKEDGSACCLIVLSPELHLVRPQPRRPFQGWRYLDGDDAPPDLGSGAADGVAMLTPKMRKELAELCLI